MEPEPEPEYENDHDDSIRGRLYNTWLSLRGWVKSLTCAHHHVRESKWITHRYPDDDLVEYRDVKVCAQCGKVMEP